MVLRECGLGALHVCLVKRMQRDNPFNRGSRPTHVFEAASDGEHGVGDRFRPAAPGPYQLDTLDSAFRLLVACCLAVKDSAKSSRLRVRGLNAGFQRSNRQPLLGILGFWVAWTIFAPQI